MTQDPVSTSNIDIEDPHRFRVRRLLTFGLPIFFLQHLLFTVFFVALDHIPLGIFNGASTALYLFLWLYQAKEKSLSWIVVLSTLEMTVFVPFTIFHLGWESGFQFWMFTHLATIFIAYRLPRYIRILLALMVLANFVFVFTHFKTNVARGFLSTDLVGLLFYYNSISSMLMVAVSMYFFNTFAERAERRFHDEHTKVRNLLLYILPEKIVKRLKGSQKSIAEDIKDCTILFADIVGFTGLSTQMAATELVDLLNSTFSRFDDFMEKFGLEKIKTIGDAYMAACGIPEPQEEQESKTVDCALLMLRAVQEINEQRGTDLALRIGIHTGKVVAGVIGKKKFSYDLWGDTVNVASRMESHGVAGSINLSEATANRIQGLYRLKPRGPVEIKGKGPMVTYLVINRL
jgi:adenylate cyclase